MGIRTHFNPEVETLCLIILMIMKIRDRGKGFSFCYFSSLRQVRFIGFLHSKWSFIMRSLRPSGSLTYWRNVALLPAVWQVLCVRCCQLPHHHPGLWVCARIQILLRAGHDRHHRLWRTNAGCGASVQHSLVWPGGGESFLHKAEGHSSVRGPEVPVSGGRAGVWYQIIRLQSFCSAHGTPSLAWE